MKKYAIGITCVLLLLLASCGKQNPGSVTLVQESSGIDDPIRSGAWINDTHIAFGSGPEVVVWDTSTQTITHHLEHGSRTITALAVNAEADQISAFAENNALYVWQLSTGTAVYTYTDLELQRSVYPVYSLYSGLNGTTIVGAPYMYAHPEEMITYVWDVPTNTLMKRPRGVLGMMIADIPNLLFEVAVETGILQAFDIKAQAIEWTYQATENEYLSINDGDTRSILFCGYTTCDLVDPHTGVSQQRITVDAAYIWTGYLLEEQVVLLRTKEFGTNVTVDTYDRTTGELISTFQIDRPSFSYQSLSLTMRIDVSSQGQLAIAFGKGSDFSDFIPIGGYKNFSPVFVYDLESGEQLATLDRHTDAVNVLAFNPSGTHLFTGSSDRTFKIWEITK